jgi:hypothetical protein
MNKPFMKLPWSIFTVKQWIGISCFGAMVIMPLEVFHFVSMILHFIYESIAYACEELLIHKAGFNKFQAQMLVFYSSLVIAVLALSIFLLNIATIFGALTTFTVNFYEEFCRNLNMFWKSLGFRQKTQLILFQLITFLSMASLFLV